MRYIFNFPDIGEGLEEGTIAEWYVEKGHKVESGDPLVKMETDKVVTDIPSPKTGTVVETHGEVGETINVGSPLVEIEVEGSKDSEEMEQPKRETQDSKEVPIKEEGAGVVGTMEMADKNVMSASVEGVEEVSPDIEMTSKKVLATPVARAMAKDLGIDINKIEGTGPAGRVTTEDIKKFNSTVPKEIRSESVTETRVDNLVEYKPLSQIRKAIAKNMITSKHNAAHMSVHEEVEISELFRIRNKYKDKFLQQDVKLSYLPFILKATALALKNHKVLNSQLDIENNRIIYKNYYNLGIAVDTDEGLVVPVIKNIDQLSILEIAIKVNEFAEKARTRKLSLEDIKEGTFTITNYGAIGGIYGVPIINYPQVGILGIGRILKKPVVRDDIIVPGIVLPLSLSVDHRIVDGGESTRFLNQIMDYLSDPVALMFE